MAKQKPKYQKKKDYTTIAIVIMIVVFFAVFAIRPSLSLIFTLFKERAEYQKVNTVLEEKIQQIIAVQNTYMTALNSKDLIDGAIPKTYELDQVKSTLSKDLQLEAFSIQKILVHPKPKNQLQTLKIGLSASTDYLNFVNFINTINKNQRLYRFTEGALLNDAKNATNSSRIKIEISLETYYFPEN